MDVARDLPPNTTAPSPGDIPINSKVTSLNLPEAEPMSIQPSEESSSFYTLACDQSLLSRNVDRWLGASGTTETTGVQGSRPAVMQRSTLATDLSASLPGTGAWYMLAMTMMPILNMGHADQWRCSQSAVLNVMELVLTHVNIACNRVQSHIRRLAQNQIAREIFAGAMDVILILYAIGFLILSLYQTAIFPR